MNAKPEPKVKCVPMDTEKILTIDWGDKKVLRYYYPNGYGGFYFDEIEYDGRVFRVRSGTAYDIKLEHDRADWEQIYRPTESSSAVERFMKAFSDPWWSDFRDAWNAVVSLCPVKIE